MNSLLIKKLVEMEDLVVPTLFKPVQFNILKKLRAGKKLNENEKRYLRGKMKGKLSILNKFMASKGEEVNGYAVFLDSLGSYYITGLEALKHNGFGWYFKTKIIEVINTKIEGKVSISNKTLKLIRVKSIKNSKFLIDKKTGLKYAANEQVLKDAKITKNKYAESVWKQMLSRYGNLFIKNYGKLKSYMGKPKIIDYVKYGV
jgi:hypothetical protein